MLVFELQSCHMHNDQRDKRHAMSYVKSPSDPNNKYSRLSII